MSSVAPTTVPASAAAPDVARVGDLLRDWRHRRHLSQLDLAIAAEVSPRHLSFVETGRSKPSRELLLHLAEHLEVPLRERNHLLLAAGFAPVHTETPLDAAPMGPVRDALDQILAGHEPYPAVVVDQRWDLVTGNAPAMGILADGVAPSLLAPPVNVIRVCLHPDGLASRIVNLAEYSEHLMVRLHRQALLSQDPGLATLLDEMREYPGVRQASSSAVDETTLLFVPLRLRVGEAVLSFFSTIATFGTALDITLAELAIEQFFPADPATAAALHGSGAPDPAKLRP
jgi:transcriptional regulator with XRE-family HTH domain